MSAIPLVPGNAPLPAEPAEAERAEPRPARTWYRQPALMAGAVILGVIVALALAAPLVTPYNPIAQNLNTTLLGPSAHHLLGTDQLGRDTWTRLLYGLRVDLRIAFIAVLFPFCIGTILGSLAGYFGSWVDVVIMRLVDVVVAFPFYVLVIALVFVLGPGQRSIYIAITAVGWVSYARIIRGEILVAKRQDYVLAAQSGGLSSMRIMGRHLLPNVVTQAIIYAMSDIVQDILAIVTLGYFGLGVPPPTADLGSMINDAAAGRGSPAASRSSPTRARVTSGQILLDGTDLVQLSSAELNRIRGPKISMIFQEPMSALNPVMRVGRQIAEGPEVHLGYSRARAAERALELMQRVGIPDPERRFRSYPHEFSGGMRQRVMIAIALACDPEIILCDEPTTALDVTIQDQILRLLARLCSESGVSLVFVTHDLPVVAQLCQDLGVMYAGRLVERGKVREVLLDPRHPYTLGLVRSAPDFESVQESLIPIPGSPPSLITPPPGCRFHPRCGFAEADCTVTDPPLLVLPGGRATACLHHERCLEATAMQRTGQ